ncbi:hypothetical protein MHU86_16602 [Fragilaria crotonensis]|nr:hypothetical protein MHU86_16602 [Fragilaria crotonensis]
MFFKLHTRRGFFKDKKEKGGSSRKSGIFRLMKGEKTAATTELFPTIEAGITFSMSEDYEESLVQSEIENDVTVKEDERTVTFSEAEVMQNELNHIRSLRAKQEEINKMRAVLEELKATHARKIAEKEKQLVKTVEIFEKLLNEREEEVTSPNRVGRNQGRVDKGVLNTYGVPARPARGENEELAILVLVRDKSGGRQCAANVVWLQLRCTTSNPIPVVLA